ncbi:MAG: hypothetical protein PHO00_07920 [bacterium]|nr:hypothetical protein [bacterium]
MKKLFSPLFVLVFLFLTGAFSEIAYSRMMPAPNITQMSDMQKDISIVEGILQKAFQANMPQGVYLEDYGLVFICQVYRRNEISIDDIKKEAWRIMKTYFPTIRGLKSGDLLVLNINDPNRIHNPQYSFPTIQLRMKKSDLDDFQSKKISESELEKRSKIMEIN